MSCAWFPGNKTKTVESQLESLTSFYKYQQLISLPLQIFPQYYSCIDTTFSGQLNLVVDSGAHPPFQPNCHHQLIHCKLNFNIEHLYLIKVLSRTITKSIVKIFKDLWKRLLGKVLFKTKIDYQISFRNEVKTNILKISYLII